jgi:stearoyl-CoA desaturase (delta-9 desaturase)
MHTLPASLEHHRVQAADPLSVLHGVVRYSPVKSIWFSSMAAGAVAGGLASFTWSAFALFLATTACVLLLGHSLGSHRKLIHDSYQCPKWLEYVLVYCGTQVGLAGPLGLLRQHELRDYAQRLPDCHDYLRHRSSFWVDAWWQLNCELRLGNSPQLRIEPGIANDRFYRFLERTWMAQQLPWAVLFYLWGGWAFVFWGVCARVTAGVFGHWLIGYFAHNHGGMHYEVKGAAVQGRNIFGTSLLTMGECWHNNHHAFPGSARFGLFAGEWDPGWWVLMLLRRAGLVWSVRLPRDLAPRPELHHLHERESRAAAVATRSPRPFIEWPAGTLSARWLRLIVGENIELRHIPASSRLRLYAHGANLQGLPALCSAFSRRNVFARIVALGAWPITLVLESLRALDMR